MQCKNSVYGELLCRLKTDPSKSEITPPRPPFKVLLNYLTDSFTYFAHWPRLQRASLQVLLIRLHCSEVLLQVLLIRPHCREVLLQVLLIRLCFREVLLQVLLIRLHCSEVLLQVLWIWLHFREVLLQVLVIRSHCRELSLQVLVTGYHCREFLLQVWVIILQRAGLTTTACGLLSKQREAACIHLQ